jgi:hypothetical protein
MNLNVDLSQLKCSIDDHFIQEPIGSECGHCVCQKFIPVQTSQEIKCFICKKTTNIRNDNDLKNIKICIPNMFTEIEKDANETIAKLKSRVFLKSVNNIKVVV